MTDVSEYADARELHPEYRATVCPKCGEETWFKHKRGLIGGEWRCVECHWYRGIAFLDVFCPDCDHRMWAEDDRWECRVCGATEPLDREALIDRLDGDTRPVRGYPGIHVGPCPFCGEQLMGGPDGELLCDHCERFYAGRFSTDWFAYAVRLDDPDRVRVNDLDDAEGESRAE